MLRRSGLAVCAVLIVGTPPPQGMDITGEGGGGRYQYGGCTGHQYEVASADAYARVRYRAESGVTLVGEGTLEQSKVKDSATSSADDVGKKRTLVSGAARVGFHGAYAGGELGLGLW